jgi:hypothetical protein
MNEENPNLPLETENQPEPVAPQPEIEPTVPPTEELPVVEPPKDETDYKAKFAESTREAQILAAQLEQERIKNSKELTNEPTDSDLQAAFPDVDWIGADSFTKTLARKTLSAERAASSLLKKDQDRDDAARWNTDLELTIAQNPTLQGKEQAFKAYANKPTHKGAPLSTLVSAFLFDATTTPSATPTPKAPGLLPGNGGPRGPEKSKLMAPEALKQLRETDPAAYRNYVATNDLTQLEF